MPKVMCIKEPKRIEIQTYEERPVGSGEVLVETLYSGISAGTQLTLYRGNNPFNEKVFDSELRIFGSQRESTRLYPNVGAWGYEEVGRVAQVGSGVQQIAVGDVVYGTWGHCSANIVTEEYALAHKLPAGLDPVVGIYSQMGCIALNAILDADIHVGETVAVFGLGVPGQIVCQLARLNGAYVIGVDPDAFRREKAAELGAHQVLDPNACDVALEIKKQTAGGVDKAVEIAGRAEVLHSAIRCCAYNGRVVCSGFITGAANGLYLGEEFHHNRIEIICSQIEGVNPSLGKQWTRLRMEKTVMQLCAEGRLDLLSLITTRIPFDRAAEAYDALDRAEEPMLQVVLEFL